MVFVQLVPTIEGGLLKKRSIGYVGKRSFWGPQRATEALWKYIFRTLYKTIARAQRARALEISRNQNSRLQDVKIPWGITLIKILAFAAGPKAIPEIRIESTSML